MSLQIDVTVVERDVEIALEVHDGETLAVVGPNGAGKSTLLALIAGMLPPTSGRIGLGERVITEVQEGRRAHLVPPYDRRITSLTQDAVLFPHLTALGNVMFGLRSQGESVREARRLARHWLDRVGVLDLAGRRPAQLSGGQAQRVAIARALAVRPQLVLLDEPMAALDIDVAPALREQLRQVLAETTALIVTHDLLDVASLADRVAVLENGRLLQLDRTAEVLVRPRSAFMARFAGLNLVRGTWRTEGIALESELLRAVAGSEIPAGTAVLGAFPPRAMELRLSWTDTAVEPGSVLHRTVRALEPHGELVRVRAGDLAADISAQHAAELHLQPGSEVLLSVPTEAVSVYPALA